MLRDIDRLTSRTYDVLVVGGGVYGLTIAYDAAQRGLATALVEADDFGSGASFNHLRTIHGGLRYLQSLDLARARESVRERRTLARIAPHAVQPLVFALPLTRSITKGKLAMHAGFLLDRFVSAGRNAGVPPSHRLRAGRVVSRSTAIQRFPGLRRQGLRGAAVWYDYETTEADRLPFAWALAATEHGAVLANHVEAIAPLTDGRRVAGIRARDRETGREIEIGAHVTVNATGSRVDHLLAPLGLSARVPLLKAMNVITRREAGEEALGGRGASGRNLFLVPWRDRALFGTWESDRQSSSDSLGVTEGEMTAFIADLNRAFPSLDLKLGDVTMVHRALVPAIAGSGGHVSLQGHEQIRDHASEGIEGIVTVAGAKYTTARAVAERVTNRLAEKLQRTAVPCRTASSPLPGGGLRDVGLTIADARREHDAGLPSDTIPHLVAAYGSRYRDVLDLSDGHPEWRTRVADDSPVIGAELVWAVRKEMAVTLRDAVLRRTPVGALGYPGDPAADRAARIVATELKWTEERIREEIDGLRRFYRWQAEPATES
jgi:glycerol-3-phosphate dehydrogenase